MRTKSSSHRIRVRDGSLGLALALSVGLSLSGCGKSAEEKNAGALAQVLARGEGIYGDHCSACHQPSGTGVHPVFPPLAATPILQDKDRLIKATLYGRPGTAMPSHCRFAAEDIAAVLTYVRNAWMSRPLGPVSAQDVLSVQADPTSPACRETPVPTAQAPEQTAAPLKPSIDRGPCGYQEIRQRWHLPALAGWELNDEEGRVLNYNVYLPPGKAITQADRTLGVDADRKSDFGSTLQEFTANHLRHYRNTFEGDVAETASIQRNDGTSLPLYHLRPKPGLPFGMYQSSVFIDESQCFIHVSLSTKTEQAHEQYLKALRELITGFKPRTK